MSTTTNAVIEEYYRANHSRLVKKYTRAAGTVWDAEDVIQSAFERALLYYTPCAVTYLPTWFDVLIRNCLIDHMNASRGVVTEELDELEHEAVPTLDPLQMRLTIEQLIMKENEEHRPLLELHFLKGYSALDIYKHNMLSYPNTRKIIQRFRDKLKKEVGVT